MGTRRDTSSWLFLHDGLPDHPKIEALSDRSFRSLIELWCYCARNLTDGYISQVAWTKRTTPKVRAELVAAGLVDELFGRDDDGIPSKSRRDGVVMHDYLDWQRSAAEAAEITGKKSAAGSVGNHQRWHVDQGKWSPDCKFCVDAGPDPGSQEPSQVRSHVRSQVGSQTDRTPIAEKRRTEPLGSVQRERSGRVRAHDAGAREATPEPPTEGRPPLRSVAEETEAEGPANPVAEMTPAEAVRRSEWAKHRGKTHQRGAARIADLARSARSGRSALIVERWARTRGEGATREYRDAMAQAIDRVLVNNRAAGYTDAQLATALEICGRKGLGPSLFAQILTESLVKQTNPNRMNAEERMRNAMEATSRHASVTERDALPFAFPVDDTRPVLEAGPVRRAEGA